MDNTVKVNPQSDREERIRKLNLLKEQGVVPYANKYEKEDEIVSITEERMDEEVNTAGRIVAMRNMGKIIFARIQDFDDSIQVVFRVGDIDKDIFKNFTKTVNAGDFIGVKGKVFKTQKGEISILVSSYTFLSKALKSLPEKWHGLKNQESRYRKRYLDLIMNKEVREVFKFRSQFIKELRQFYFEYNFNEIDTPVLCNTASGALAKPFVTHHNALGTDVFLRIAPEIFLKQAIIGGYERVFEVARSFRNEGIDASHLQDFTMVEHYAAYWDFHKNMDFTEEMLTTIIKKLKGSLKVEIIGRDDKVSEIDFTPSWPRVSFKDLLIKDCGIDIDLYPTVEDLRKAITEKNIEIEDMDKLGRGNLIDSLYKKVSRPKIINPTFVISHPLDLSPLARKNDKNPLIADRFQLVINTWEVVNAYSELIDPIDQQERFEGQMKAKEMGDEEAMNKDDEYVDAMEYGMPPISGWGMGIERIVALLTKQTNLRDVVLFPLMRPEGKENE